MVFECWTLPCLVFTAWSSDHCLCTVRWTSCCMLEIGLDAELHFCGGEQSLSSCSRELACARMSSSLSQRPVTLSFIHTLFSSNVLYLLASNDRIVHVPPCPNWDNKVIRWSVLARGFCLLAAGLRGWHTVRLERCKILS